MSATITEFDVSAWPVAEVPCNLCGGTEVSVVAEQDRYGLPTRIVACVACGLRFISPRMSAEGYAAFYAHGYRPLFERLIGRPYTLRDIEADQLRYAADLGRTVAGRIPATPRLLDLGGSTGIVARHFRQMFGGTATVVEPCADELARATGCVPIHGSAETVTFPPASVDVVLLCRTVDHLLDPKGVLQRAREWIAPSGVLVVDAMDVEAWPEQARYKVDHPYAFTADTLRALVEAAGWTVQQAWTRQQQRYVGLVCGPKE